MKTIALLAVLLAGNAFALAPNDPALADYGQRCADLKARNAQLATEDAIRDASIRAMDNTPAVTTYRKIGDGVWQGGGTTYYNNSQGVTAIRN